VKYEPRLPLLILFMRVAERQGFGKEIGRGNVSVILYTYR